MCIIPWTHTYCNIEFWSPSMQSSGWCISATSHPMQHLASSACCPWDAQKHTDQPHQVIPHLYLTGFLKQHLAAKGQNAGLVNWMHCAQGTANTRWDLRIFHDLLPGPKNITIVTTALVGLQYKSVSFDFSLLIIIHSPSFITTSVTPW